ncbi:hypothetical protein [Cellulomonas edaphi]|uniref:Secreted protein n=1 Tax=Cellulomonas edaphi TaxID=3053468 RepID=A0ABT7SA27_9CELL|nr:hypothetical protein [Cellulomons edaphi]MDM7832466.1 hypothetical protein [Cellulomons edaphi]
MSEPVGDDLARICSALRAADLPGAFAAAREVPPARKAAVLAALESVAPLFDHDWRFSGADPRGVPSQEWPARAALFIVRAALAAAPAQVATEIASAWWVAEDKPGQEVCALVEPHPPAWRAKLVGSLLHGRAVSWGPVHHLVLTGLVEAPDDPLYASGLLGGMRWASLPAARAADPSLDELLHRLWSIPDVGRRIGDAYGSDGTWARNLELAPDRSVHSEEEWAGLLDAWGANDAARRPAVVDGCLAALAGAGGTRTGDLRGWALVHGRIQVTLDEACERQAAYLDLVAAGAPPSAAIGRAQAALLLRAGRLDPGALLDVTPDVLVRPEKGAVREHLALLTSAVKSGLVDPAACGAVVAPVADQVPSGVGPVVERLLALCGTTSSAPAPVTEAWTPPVPVDVAPRPVEPVRTTDELVDLLVHVLHDPSDPLEVERAVDGMVRLRDVPSGVGHALPRSDDGLSYLVGRWLGEQPTTTHDFGSVRRIAYTHDPSTIPPGVPSQRYEGYPMSRFLQADGTYIEHKTVSWSWEHTVERWLPSDLVGARLHELGRLFSGPPVGILALPTAGHGTVSVDAFLARLRAQVDAGAPLTGRDVATAIMRVDPADRAALRASGALGEQALIWLDRTEASRTWQWGANEPHTWVNGPTTVGPLALWTAATPEPADGRPEDPVRWWFDTSTVVDHWGGHLVWGRRGHGASSSALLHLPSHPDVAAVHLQPEVITSIEDPDADLGGVLRAMADRRVPLGGPATDLLLWAGSYRSARTRAASAEAIATAARGGVLDGCVLGEGILRLVGPGAGPFLQSSFHLEPEPPKLTRIAATLADAARIDEHGELAVLTAVVTCLPVLRVLRGGVALLEIAAGIAERCGLRVALPEPLDALARGRASTRTAQEARRLAGVGRTAVLWAPAAR